MSRIAIIGSGISGLTAAYLLCREHRVSLFEANDYLGGHTATIDVKMDGKSYAIDSGFIVFNDRTYPNFIKLMQQLGVAMQPTQMSFSVHHADSGFEYNGHTLASLFAQRSNLLNPRFYHFLSEMLRFNRLAKKAYADDKISHSETLEHFLVTHRFSEFFANHYILPMVAAIWSSSTIDAKAFPLAFFLRFFNHHGLLNIIDRPQWYVIRGGSKSYIPRLTQQLRDIRLNTPVKQVVRTTSHVLIETAHGEQETFDDVVLACHADQALALLTDASDVERSILQDMAYRNNEVVLHTDTGLLPRQPGAWASWNYRLSNRADSAPCVTYNMNILQGISAEQTFCVTLNQSAAIDPQKIIKRFTYAHPVYTAAALAAQQRRREICGKNRTHFCGAYWLNGFHEDGVRSALNVGARFGARL